MWAADAKKIRRRPCFLYSYFGIDLNHGVYAPNWTTVDSHMRNATTGR